MPTEPHYLYTELSNKLREDESLFDWFELGATDGLWYWDLNQPEHEWLSPQFKKTFGYADDEIPHTSEWWQANIFDEDLPGVLDNFEKHKADPTHPYDQIVRYRHKDGHTVWVRCRGLIIRDDAGNPSRMLGAHTDLTELMETREKLEAIRLDLKSRLEDVSETNKVALETAGIGIWLWDLKTNQIVWDDTMLALYELETSNEPLEYKHWRNSVHVDDIDFIETRIQNAIQDKKIFRAEIRVPLKSGSIRYIKVAAEIFYDEEGIPLRMRGANWDITDEKLREQELQRSNRDLEQFAYVASHDLRAPLSGIRQLAAWIEEDMPSPPNKVKQHINTMHQRIDRLENMLSDILTYSRANHPQAPEQQPTRNLSLPNLIREIYADLGAPEAMNLEVKLEGIEEIMMLPEVTKLTQVIQNLMNNAVKHRRQDDTTISVALRCDDHKIHFEVADMNEPIKPEYYDVIFNMFQTLKSRDEVEGSGMGLPIARRLVESLGQRLWYSATPTSEDHAKTYQNHFCFTWPLYL
jgi:PAS domain S-box-containing protein